MSDTCGDKTTHPRCTFQECDRVPAFAGYCAYHLKFYDQLVTTSAKDRDEKDVHEQQLVDVAKGIASTAFIFERDDGSLTGFKVPTDSIQWCDFTLHDSADETEVEA